MQSGTAAKPKIWLIATLCLCAATLLLACQTRAASSDTQETAPTAKHREDDNTISIAVEVADEEALGRVVRVLEEQSKEPVTSAMGDPKLVQTGIATGKVSAQVIDEIAGIPGLRYVKAVGPQEAMEGSVDDGLVHFQLVPVLAATTARMGRDAPGGYPHLIVGTQVHNACSIPVPHQITESPGRVNIALYEWEPTVDTECILGGLRHGSQRVDLADLLGGRSISINGWHVLAAAKPGSFIPGVSPSVIPNNQHKETPTRTTVVTSDLPENWIWEHDVDPSTTAPDDGWLLRRADGEILGGIYTAGEDCWTVQSKYAYGGGVCYGTFQIGSQALEILKRAEAFTSTPTDLEERYEQEGERLHRERTADVVWADGSNWVDGISHSLPSLPLPEGTLRSEHMTCAQAEALNSAMFPEEEANRYTWHEQANADQVGSNWNKLYATAVWGNDPRSLHWLEQESFLDWCGVMMQPLP